MTPYSDIGFYLYVGSALWWTEPGCNCVFVVSLIAPVNTEQRKITESHSNEETIGTCPSYEWPSLSTVCLFQCHILSLSICPFYSSISYLYNYFSTLHLFRCRPQSYFLKLQHAIETVTKLRRVSYSFSLRLLHILIHKYILISSPSLFIRLLILSSFRHRFLPLSCHPTSLRSEIILHRWTTGKILRLSLCCLFLTIPLRILAISVISLFIRLLTLPHTNAGGIKHSLSVHKCSHSASFPSPEIFLLFPHPCLPRSSAFSFPYFSFHTLLAEIYYRLSSADVQYSTFDEGQYRLRS